MRSTDHEPTPGGDPEGGWIRCTCGWVGHTTPNTRSKRGQGMGTVWAKFRDHWNDMHPVDVEAFHEPDQVDAVVLFDPTPYQR